MPVQINDEYDIGKAFAVIEDELMASMIRNMNRHKVEEVAEDKQWSMWQAEQLKDGFLNDPGALYSDIINRLIGE